MDTKLCFVVAPIGEPASETRKRSDQLLKHVIRPAVSERGFEAVRADEISEPGLITSQVIQHIIDAQLVVADLTERNPNVFYELALRHALRKPLIQLISKGDEIPFDVAGMRTISIDHRDLDSVEEAKREIVRQIDAIEQGVAKIETPISVSLDLQTLRQSENPESRSLAQVLPILSEIQRTVATIEKRLMDAVRRIDPAGRILRLYAEDLDKLVLPDNISVGEALELRQLVEQLKDRLTTTQRQQV